MKLTIHQGRNMNLRLLLFAPILFLFLCKSYATTMDTESLAEPIEEFVLDYVQDIYPDEDDIEIKIGYLDHRLKLNVCEHPLDIRHRSGQINLGRMSLEVQCHQPKRWKLVVPVQVHIYKNIALSNKYLKRGDLVEESDISLVRRSISRLSQGFFQSKKELVGKQVRRSIRQGALFKPNMIKEPLWVKRGNTVSIISKTSGFTVRATGIAMEDGVSGELITVKNKSSKITVEGIVTAPDTITVNL